ncbi:MAG: tetratricopeptide repeat-containing sulfotransferase family protein [Devosia sp.]
MPHKPTAPKPAIEAILRQGIALQQSRDFIGAERQYQTVLRDHPDHPDALNLLGTLAMEAKRLDVAEQLFTRALAKEPRHPGYLSNLGSVLNQSRQHHRAAQAFEAALPGGKGPVDAMVGLCYAYRALNRADDARAVSERAYRAYPAHPKVALARAEILTSAGDTTGAAKLLRGIIASGGPSAVPALLALSRAHKFVAGDTEPALIERLAQDPRAPEASRAGLFHALGKARADLGDYDGAFAAFSAAKTLLGRNFDADQSARYYDAMIEALTPQFFEQRRDFGFADVSPIFIVGMPRSGTTLTEQIASSHSQVVGVGEVPTMNQLAARLGWRKSQPAELIAAISRLTPEQSREIAQAYLDDVVHYGGTGPNIIDKLPHNYEFLALIALLFPRARIIHCTRDPLDNCVSCFTHSFNEAHGYNADLSILGRYYRSYERLMTHWKSALPLAIFDNAYEELVADQEGQSRRLIAYLGLAWEDACLNFQDNDRLVLTPSQWQVRQPIYRSSLQQWKRYAAHLGPLKEALGIPS